MNNDKKEILIITDEITDYSRNRSLLEDANVEISHRTNFAEAARFLRFNDADLIIVELDIPKFRTKNVASLRKFIKRCPVINIVNNIAMRALEECIKIDCIVLEKPLNNDTLSFHVNKLLFNGNSVNKEEITITDGCMDDTPFCDGENYAEG